MQIKSTGQVARELGVPEPRLNDLIRRQKIDPPPTLFAGRRLWEDSHVQKARQLLGLADAGHEPKEST